MPSYGNTDEPQCLDLVHETSAEAIPMHEWTICSINGCERQICIGGVVTSVIDRCLARDKGILAGGGVVFRSQEA